MGDPFPLEIHYAPFDLFEGNHYNTEKMGVLCISNVSPSITLACPIMSSASVPFDVVIKVTSAISPSPIALAAVLDLTAEQFPMVQCARCGAFTYFSVSAWRTLSIAFCVRMVPRLAGRRRKNFLITFDC